MERTTDSHGLGTAPTVLLIIDMFSDFAFPQGSAILRAARRIAPHIEALKARAAHQRMPCIYVNDNLGAWRSDFAAISARCVEPRAPGKMVAARLMPDARDLVILKPRQSAFYATPLGLLLEQAKTKRLILTGLCSHQCILFTANDAHLRGLELVVPADCIGAAKVTETRFALKYFNSVLAADIREASKLRLR